MSKNPKFIVKEEPPARSRRPTRWSAIAEECRATPGEWYRVAKPFRNKNVVLQVSSNIRSTHRRSKRVHGFNANERWESSWAPSEKNDGTFHIWLRFVGNIDTSAGSVDE